MRTGISLSITRADLDRLQALVKDRNAPQKHVWRARIVLLTAEGLGTNAIMRETGKAKTCVWRWQERFAAEGFDSLLRDKTRPSRIAKLDPSVAERVVALTMEAPPGETQRRPPGVSPASFLAHPPDLQLWPLMDMDFAIPCPLVRPALSHIRCLFVGSRFCFTLPSDDPSRDRPCASVVLHLH